MHARLTELKLFDLRWSLTDPHHGISSYLSGHIPGAVFVDLDRDLSAKRGDGRHPLPTVEAFADTLGRLGTTNTDHVVVYDDAGGAIAARMWWMLRSIGHDEVALLDGGLDAWRDAGYEMETGRHEPEQVVYEPRHDFTGVVASADLAGRQIVDVRAPERYRGEHEPVDAKAGHIPGALNLPLSGSLTPSGTFRDTSALQTHFEELEPRPVVSCGSGVNACHTALAMVVAGRSMPDVYIGSFSDWSSRPLPVNTGPNP